MDILLTPEEQKDARLQAITAARSGELIDYDDAICRAQVGKVVEWVERETAPHDPNHYWMGARRILREETLVALREAAGEGK